MAAANPINNEGRMPLVSEGPAVKESAAGGAIESLANFQREMVFWNPGVIAPDEQIAIEKGLNDSRARDILQRDGYAYGALQTIRDSVIGTQYRLNCHPDTDVLGIEPDDPWIEEFQVYCESRFNLLADSEECWFDAQRERTLTGMLRLVLAQAFMHGETLGTVEWIREEQRPFKTAIQLISPTRLSNPNYQFDTRDVRGGIRRDRYGRAIGYYIRRSFPNTMLASIEDQRWAYVPCEKPWGRLQVLHLYDPLQADQSRGVADIVAVLKDTHMAKRFRDITLQSAVVNASYAAAIESELPREVVYAMMGAGGNGLEAGLKQYMSALAKYVAASDNIHVDGTKMPHLFPGTKLNMIPLGTPGGVGTGFENSLLRHIAMSVGISPPEFMGDFSSASYSALRAAIAKTAQGMNAKKKQWADKWAKWCFTLWFEEEWNANKIPLWRGATRDDFYDPVIREALLSCSFIGSARSQIDEMKETQAAILRIKSGLSTFEKECALMGEDFRRIFKQRLREQKMLEEMGLVLDMNATKPDNNQRQSTMTDGREDEEGDDEGDDDDDEAKEQALVNLIQSAAAAINPVPANGE